jgi:hypothetical protein
MTSSHNSMQPQAFAANICVHCHVTVGQLHIVGCQAGPGICGAMSARKIADYLPDGEWRATKHGVAYLGSQHRIQLHVESNLSLRVLEFENHDPQLSADEFADDLVAVIDENLTPRKTRALIAKLSTKLPETNATSNHLSVESVAPHTTAAANKAGLTVDAAIAALTRISNHRQGASLLVVGYQPGAATVGCTPATPVTCVSAGFDWDNGRVFMATGQPLGIAGPELVALKKTSADQAQTLFDVEAIMTNAKLTPARKLAAIALVMANVK